MILTGCGISELSLVMGLPPLQPSSMPPVPLFIESTRNDSDGFVNVDSVSEFDKGELQ